MVGDRIRLDPLGTTDVDELADLVRDPNLYSSGYVIHRCPVDDVDARDLVRSVWLDPPMLDGVGHGRVTYAVRLARTSELGQAGTLVGTSSFGDCHLDWESGHIGWTLYGRRWWGTAVNPEAKLLLMTEAFENLGYGRVKIQTDGANTRSQAAIAKLGATREGVLRRHKRREDGTFRDTVVFSVLADEWPRVKHGLQTRLT